jgi:hypothetical protein
MFSKPKIKAGQMSEISAVPPGMSDRMRSNQPPISKTAGNVRHFYKLSDTALNNPKPHFPSVIESPKSKEQLNQVNGWNSSCTLRTVNNTSTPT